MSLPEIFKNNIKNETKEPTYRGKFTELKKENKLKGKVHIKTNTKDITTTIIGQTPNYIITKERDVIYINDIIEITNL